MIHEQIYFSVKYPSTWGGHIDDATLRHVGLDVDDLEFIHIKAGFEATAYGKKIVSIQRIENSTLYNGYAIRKQFMNQSNPPGTKNERWLYHGCRKSDSLMICSSGFMQNDYAHMIKHGSLDKEALYGEGKYFAIKASYAAHPFYSPADRSGHRCLFLARVLTGEYTLGSAGLKAPPQKKSSKGKVILYDSVVDNMDSPEVFVVFSDAQCYPEYLITFK